VASARDVGVDVVQQSPAAVHNPSVKHALATFGRKIRDAERWGRIGASVIFCKPERISVDGEARD